MKATKPPRTHSSPAPPDRPIRLARATSTGYGLMGRAAVYECDQPVLVEGHVLHRPANLGLRFPLHLVFPSVTYRATPFWEGVHGIVRAGRADGGRPEGV